MGFVMLIVFVIGSFGIIDICYGFGINYGSFRSCLVYLKFIVEINEGDKVVVVIGFFFYGYGCGLLVFFL